MKFIQWIENFFLACEQFFNNVAFIPRLLNALKVGFQAMNDELFKGTRRREQLIKDREKVNIKTQEEKKEVPPVDETKSEPFDKNVGEGEE